MAVDDKSLYLDTTNENGPKLMNSGKVAMLVTGPWDLSQLSDIEYGVQVMPTYAGSSGGHQTIAGPDNWVVFDNGDKRKQAAIDFVKWLSAPEQVKAFSLSTGDLPIRTSVGDDKAVLDELNKNVPGTAEFVENLKNVHDGQAAGRAVSGDLRSARPGDRVRHARQGTAEGRPGLRRPGRRREAGREVGSRCLHCFARLSRTDTVSGWALVSPAAILIGIFGLLPVLMSLQLSFQKSDLLSDETPWVGFDNYKKLADDPVFVEAIKHTIVYTALFVPGTMLVGLFIAAALNRSVRFISVYRTAAYITMAVSTISQGIIFLWLTDRDYGLVNAALNAVGVPVAAVPGLAVAGAVRDRGDDDLGLDGILRDRVSGCAARCSG